MIGHSPRRSNLCSSTLWIITRCWVQFARSWWLAQAVSQPHSGVLVHGAPQTGSLNVSPLVSTAQAMRAFFAAIATTAFQ
jgi:hypothetical protein